MPEPCATFYLFIFPICSLIAGDVPRVDGQLAVARAFGDKSLKKHLSSEPDVSVENISEDTDYLILASDGIWKVNIVLHPKVFVLLINTYCFCRFLFCILLC